MLKRFLARKPDFYVGGEESPYLLRWYILPRNRFFNIYLHKFLRDDDDRALHDHPWKSLSFSLGEYFELIGGEDLSIANKIMYRQAFRFIYRKATHIHRIILPRDKNGNPVPAWTIFITGPKIRDWGFWCPKGFRRWEIFCDERDHGKVGRGCD